MNQFSMKRNWGPEPRYNRVINYKRPDNKFVVIAGPCSVESQEQIWEMAKIVSGRGATHLRGGVFRTGTYPGNNFGWIDESLIKDYSDAARTYGLKNIIEVLDYSDESLDLVMKYASCFQVGARQMQNYTLLRKLGSTGKPVFLKRNTGATRDEWLGAAEHLLAGGTSEIYLIERGISTHNTDVRWTLDLMSIPAIKSISDIPVICDASHGTGRRDLVEPMTLAGVAAGAAGILVEVHTDPDRSLSDPDQAITPAQFQSLMDKVTKIKEVVKCAV